MDETRIAGYFDYAVVAEWLRRLTRNQIPSGSVGSNPTVCVSVLHLLNEHSNFLKSIYYFMPITKNNKLFSYIILYVNNKYIERISRSTYPIAITLANVIKVLYFKSLHFPVINERINQ